MSRKRAALTAAIFIFGVLDAAVAATPEARALLVKDHTRTCVPCRRALMAERQGKAAAASQPLHAFGSSRQARILRWSLAEYPDSQVGNWLDSLGHVTELMRRKGLTDYDAFRTTCLEKTGVSFCTVSASMSWPFTKINRNSPPSRGR